MKYLNAERKDDLKKHPLAMTAKQAVALVHFLLSVRANFAPSDQELFEATFDNDRTDYWDKALVISLEKEDVYECWFISKCGECIKYCEAVALFQVIRLAPNQFEIAYQDPRWESIFCYELHDDEPDTTNSNCFCVENPLDHSTYYITFRISLPPQD